MTRLSCVWAARPDAAADPHCCFASGGRVMFPSRAAIANCDKDSDPSIHCVEQLHTCVGGCGCIAAPRGADACLAEITWLPGVVQALQTLALGYRPPDSGRLAGVPWGDVARNARQLPAVTPHLTALSSLLLHDIGWEHAPGGLPHLPQVLQSTTGRVALADQKPYTRLPNGSSSGSSEACSGACVAGCTIVPPSTRCRAGHVQLPRHSSF